MNTIRTPRQGTTEKSRRIAAAVDDEEWQKFRVSMKGTRTATKLHMLKEYYKAHSEHTSSGDPVDAITPTSPYCRVCICLDNYVKALARGGQLYAGESLDTLLARDWKPRIKRN